MPTMQMRVVHRTLGPGLRGWLRLEVSGRAHVPGEGGVLLAANHRSVLDHVCMFAACPRPMRFLGKQELARGLTGRFNTAMGMVPVDRGSADALAVDTVVRLLQEGEVVGVFPEGSRSRTGHLYRFRSGAARIAAASRQPVVPVGIAGTAELWGRDGLPLRRRPPAGLVRVRFGPALAPPGGDPRARRAFTQRLHEAVASLCEQPLAEGFAPIRTPAAGDAPAP